MSYFIGESRMTQLKILTSIILYSLIVADRFRSFFIPILASEQFWVTILFTGASDFARSRLIFLHECSLLASFLVSTVACINRCPSDWGGVNSTTLQDFTTKGHFTALHLDRSVKTSFLELPMRFPDFSCGNNTTDESLEEYEFYWFGLETITTVFERNPGRILRNV